MASILLTGARGYLGACVASALERNRLPFDPLAIRLEQIQPASLDYEYVIHCAGAPRHRAAELDSANHVGTRRLLAGLRRPCNIIHVSTRGVYAPSDQRMIDETWPAKPVDEYGRTKWMAEQATQASGHAFVIFRPGTLFGFGVGSFGPPFCFPATLVRRWLNGEEVVLYTPDREHDFLYVHALADLIVKALPPGPHWNDLYNVVGPPRSLWAFVETAQAVVERHTGRPARILRQPGPMPRLPLASTAKLASRLAPVRQPGDAWILGAMVAASIAEQARENPVREAPPSLPSFPGNP